MTVNVSDKIYGQLLMQVLPSAIQNDEELARLTNEVDRLMTKGIKQDGLSPEETRLLETLAILIEAYEDEHYPIEPADPLKMLKMLMAENNYRQKDLLHIFGSSGIASEVINGKRSISKAQAKKLAEFFNVSVELFI
jgi:HTH-type transcriptional regulator / antitoxin HigA